jgi:uncharacterized protein
MRIIFLSILIVMWVEFSPAQQDNTTIPTVYQRVTDGTGTLSRDEIGILEATLARFEQATSNQIVVLMVSSAQKESFEEYSLRIAEKNKLGKKGKDNGILLLIAKDDRKIRIEVGYGLEGAMPDAISDQIIRQIITPKFRQGDFFGGIRDGLDAIMLATKGEFKGEQRNRGMKNYLPFIFVLLMLIFGMLPRIFGGGRRHSIGSSGYYSRGPWLGGGLGGFGGGGFGGGGSFGGFSGGGGSFGGGGASGSW